MGKNREARLKNTFRFRLRRPRPRQNSIRLQNTHRRPRRPRQNLNRRPRQNTRSRRGGTFWEGSSFSLFIVVNRAQRCNSTKQSKASLRAAR